MLNYKNFVFIYSKTILKKYNWFPKSAPMVNIIKNVGSVNASLILVRVSSLDWLVKIKCIGNCIKYQPNVKLDFPPGGLWTLTEVFPAAGCSCCWGLGCWTCCCWGCCWGACWGWVVFFLGACSGTSQPREKLLLPPGAWWTLTEVVPLECFEKSIYWLFKIEVIEAYNPPRINPDESWIDTNILEEYNMSWTVLLLYVI